MMDILVRNNNAFLDMGWGFGKHEEDLFLKKKRTEGTSMTCFARAKRICGGLCHWFVVCIVKDNMTVCVETKIWVSRSDKRIYLWDVVGRLVGKDDSGEKTIGFYGFAETVPGIEGVVKVLKNMMNVVLAYRAGDVGGYTMSPMDAKAVEMLRREWDGFERKDHPEPSVFKQTQKHLDTLAKGLVNNELASLDELLKRADFPERIIVNEGELRTFYVYP